MRVRHKMSNLGCKTQKSFADLNCSSNWLLLQDIDYSIGFLPCRTKAVHTQKKKSWYRTPKTWDSYKKQRNFCVILLRKTKKEYVENINVKDINYNKKFLKTIKPFFSNKGLNNSKLVLIHNNNLISEESVPANTINL